MICTGWRGAQALSTEIRAVRRLLILDRADVRDLHLKASQFDGLIINQLSGWQQRRPLI